MPPFARDSLDETNKECHKLITELSEVIPEKSMFHVTPSPTFPPFPAKSRVSFFPGNHRGKTNSKLITVIHYEGNFINLRSSARILLLLRHLPKLTSKASERNQPIFPLLSYSTIGKWPEEVTK